LGDLHRQLLLVCFADALPLCLTLCPIVFQLSDGEICFDENVVHTGLMPQHHQRGNVTGRQQVPGRVKAIFQVGHIATATQVQRVATQKSIAHVLHGTMAASHVPTAPTLGKGTGITGHIRRELGVDPTIMKRRNAADHVPRQSIRHRRRMAPQTVIVGPNNLRSPRFHINGVESCS